MHYAADRMTWSRRGVAVAGALVVAFAWVGGCTSEVSSTADNASSTKIDSANPVLEPDDRLAEGVAHALRVNTHCGVRLLSILIDDTTWITDEATVSTDWMPEERAASIENGNELITLIVELAPGAETLTASAVGRAVEYRPVGDDDNVPLCA